MINRINHGDFHFDPNRRSVSTPRSTATDPAAAAAFEDALQRAAEKVEKTLETGEKPRSGTLSL